ncbi:phosphate/phosphite/phosphonate ABC transporter substrate-binding protein [Rubrimonas sp.]|uniref:phosphate/phosphite/phosphonate ABC transporter substrate-binding protein n=1 Tax=Rubrimonas sp. TaxID=2036015 RepID=UPI002FDCAC80
MKTTLIAALLVSTASLPAFAESWTDTYKLVRFGVSAAENQKDTIAKYAPLEQYLEKRFGVDFEIFPASNYDGVIQALAADQIEFAYLGTSSYGAAYTATNGGVVPMLAKLKKDGTSGYVSVIVTRCDSGAASVADLKGKVHAFPDPDSTSGFAVPFYNLVQQGYDPSKHFASFSFSGNHEAGVQGVVNGTFDSASTWAYTPEDGAVSRMVAKGMVKEGEVCQIWQSPEITGDPFTARSNLPAAMIADVKQALIDVVTQDPAAWSAMDGGTDTHVGWIEVEHDLYVWIIEMREWLKSYRRSQG